MSLTVGEFQDRFPELAHHDPTVIQRWLDEALRNSNEVEWGDRWDDAVAWQTAHFLATFASPSLAANSAGRSGPIQSETEDRISKTYAVSERYQDDDFGTTAYGRRYLTMLKHLVVTRCV